MLKVKLIGGEVIVSCVREQGTEKKEQKDPQDDKQTKTSSGE